MKLKKIVYPSFTGHFMDPTLCKDALCPRDVGTAAREKWPLECSMQRVTIAAAIVERAQLPREGPLGRAYSRLPNSKRRYAAARARGMPCR